MKLIVYLKINEYWMIFMNKIFFTLLLVPILLVGVSTVCASSDVDALSVNDCSGGFASIADYHIVADDNVASDNPAVDDNGSGIEFNGEFSTMDFKTNWSPSESYNDYNEFGTVFDDLPFACNYYGDVSLPTAADDNIEGVRPIFGDEVIIFNNPITMGDDCNDLPDVAISLPIRGYSPTLDIPNGDSDASNFGLCTVDSVSPILGNSMINNFPIYPDIGFDTPLIEADVHYNQNTNLYLPLMGGSGLSSGMYPNIGFDTIIAELSGLSSGMYPNIGFDTIIAELSGLSSAMYPNIGFDTPLMEFSGLSTVRPYSGFNVSAPTMGIEGFSSIRPYYHDLGLDNPIVKASGFSSIRPFYLDFGLDNPIVEVNGLSTVCPFYPNIAFNDSDAGVSGLSAICPYYHDIGFDTPLMEVCGLSTVRPPQFLLSADVPGLDYSFTFFAPVSANTIISMFN